MLPFEDIDEIAAYRNVDGTYLVEMSVAGEDKEGRPAQTTIKIPHASLDVSMSFGLNYDHEYDIRLKG